MSLFFKNNKHIKYGITIILVVMLYFFISSLSSCFLVQKRAYKFDTSISKKSIFSISLFLKNYSLKTKLFSAGKLLSKEFYFIDSICCMQKSSGVVDIAISSKIPFIKVGKDRVMTTDGLIIKADYFNKKSLSNKARCSIFGLQDVECTVVPACVEGLKKIPENIYEKYNVCWQSFVKGILQDRSQKRFFIVFNNQTVPNQNLLKACNKIRDKLEQDGAFKKKQWVADVRFDNQIIVNSGREVEYGKSFYE